MRGLIFFVCFAFSFGAFAQTKVSYKEQYRPRFHYSPAINWCNDPNGLVYNNGEAVLTAQIFPDKSNNSIELFCTDGRSQVLQLRLWKMKSIW